MSEYRINLEAPLCEGWTLMEEVETIGEAEACARSVSEQYPKLNVQIVGETDDGQRYEALLRNGKFKSERKWRESRE